MWLSNRLPTMSLSNSYIDVSAKEKPCDRICVNIIVYILIGFLEAELICSAAPYYFEMETIVLFATYSSVAACKYVGTVGTYPDMPKLHTILSSIGHQLDHQSDLDKTSGRSSTTVLYGTVLRVCLMFSHIDKTISNYSY